MKAPSAWPPSSEPKMCDSEVEVESLRRCWVRAVSKRGQAEMMWCAVCRGSPHSQWCGSLELGLNRAEYSPVKAWVVSNQMPVEKVRRGCVASPRTNGGIRPSGGKVRAMYAGWRRGASLPSFLPLVDCFLSRCGSELVFRWR